MTGEMPLEAQSYISSVLANGVIPGRVVGVLKTSDVFAQTKNDGGCRAGLGSPQTEIIHSLLLEGRIFLFSDG